MTNTDETLPPTNSTTTIQTPVKLRQKPTESLTPNTRKRKSRLADDLASQIEKLNTLNAENHIDVIKLSLQKLSILDKIQYVCKPNKAGRKLTSLPTRRAVWKFWHDQYTQSTLTSCPAKLNGSDKPKIQNNLEYIDTVTIIKQRNCTFFQNHWLITSLTMRQLFQNYLSQNESHIV